MNKEDVKTMLKKLIEPKNENNKKKSNAYLLILLAAGVLIMLISNVMTSSSPSEEDSTPVFDTPSEEEEDAEVFGDSSSNPTSIREYEEYYENQLKDILAEAIGISAVSVKVNLASSEKKIYEKNRNKEKQVTEETDREGGKRTIENYSTDEEVIIINDGNKETPVVVGTEKPEATGVIVVAEGAENMQTKQRIIESVTRFLDVPSHQVSVLPKKLKEE